MFTSDEEEKKYIPPDYSNDPEDDDDDDDDDISEDDDGEVETYLDNQEQLNKKIMTTTPFNSTPNWGNTGSSWGTGTQQSPWGQPQNSSPWSKPTTPSWGSSTPGWGSNNGSTWGSSSFGANTWNNSNQTGKKEIDRQKKVIFCDVLDCLIETIQSSGKPGLLPRGIYDIRLRFEVWDKIACFNPTRVYAMVPRCLLLSSNGSESWKIMLNYVICSLSEYLRVPYYNCQILVQSTVDQAKEDMIRPIIKNNFIPKKEIIQIGLNSGLYGQNNKDQFAAQCCGIDYVDLGQLLSSYY